jgi:mRNA interferase RelE/StbE
LQIKYSRDALKFLSRQSKKTVERIREAIIKLTFNPPEGDISILHGYSDNRMRLRIGSWRVIFAYTSDNQIEILLIIDIGNRGDIYK